MRRIIFLCTAEQYIRYTRTHRHLYFKMCVEKDILFDTRIQIRMLDLCLRTRPCECMISDFSLWSTRNFSIKMNFHPFYFFFLVFFGCFSWLVGWLVEWCTCIFFHTQTLFICFFWLTFLISFNFLLYVHVYMLTYFALALLVLMFFPSLHLPQINPINKNYEKKNPVNMAMKLKLRRLTTLA